MCSDGQNVSRLLSSLLLFWSISCTVTTRSTKGAQGFLVPSSSSFNIPHGHQTGLLLTAKPCPIPGSTLSPPAKLLGNTKIWSLYNQLNQIFINSSADCYAAISKCWTFLSFLAFFHLAFSFLAFLFVCVPFFQNPFPSKESDTTRDYGSRQINLFIPTQSKRNAN